MLDIKNLSVHSGGKDIVNDVSFSVREGEWLMIIGPNGAGKSTIVNAVSHAVNYSGSINFKGKNIKTFKPKDLARSIAVLSQHHNVSYDFSVEEVVRLGRYAYSSGIFGKNNDEECDFYIQDAIQKTGLQSVLKQSVLTLSGGELQRTFLAQILAQNPQLLILDEPTNHLDLIYQKQVFSIIQEWLRQPNRAVISVVHDLSLAKLYGTHAVLLDKGSVCACGTVQDVMQNQNLNSVYGIDVAQWLKNLYSLW